ARSVPLPTRSGGEGLGVGGLSRRHDQSSPPTPDPSPPLAQARKCAAELAGGGEPEQSSTATGAAERKTFTSTGRGVKRTGGLHTVYISPLKALAVDIARNLEAPIAEMGLPIKVETRTGDTPVSRRQRQRRYPPDILLTTPEQLALLLSSDDAPFL